MRKPMVTIYKIGISDPEGDFALMGHTDDGEPIVRKRTRTIPPSTIVELTEEEIAELLPLEAIRDPDERELALYEEMQAAKGAAR